MHRLNHCPLCEQRIGSFHQQGCRIFELNIGHQERVQYARRYGESVPDIQQAVVEHPLRKVYVVDCELTACGCSTILVREYRRGGHRGFYQGYHNDTVCPRATWTVPLEPPEGHALAVWHALYKIPAGWDPQTIPGMAIITDPSRDTLHTTGPFPTWTAAALWLDVLGCFTTHHGIAPQGPVPHCPPTTHTVPKPEEEGTR